MFGASMRAILLGFDDPMERVSWLLFLCGLLVELGLFGTLIFEFPRTLHTLVALLAFLALTCHQVLVLRNFRVPHMRDHNGVRAVLVVGVLFGVLNGEVPYMFVVLGWIEGQNLVQRDTAFKALFFIGVLLISLVTLLWDRLSRQHSIENDRLASDAAPEPMPGRWMAAAIIWNCPTRYKFIASDLGSLVVALLLLLTVLSMDEMFQRFVKQSPAAPYVGFLLDTDSILFVVGIVVVIYSVVIFGRLRSAFGINPAKLRQIAF